MKYIPREEWSVEHLRYWKEGNKWCCAVPYKNIFKHQTKDAWKKSGLIGQGKTQKKAAEDWESWIRASDAYNAIF